MSATDFAHSQRYLSEFLEPLMPILGRRERRVGATRYLQGLLLPGERKSVEPMAQRLGIDAKACNNL